MSLCRMMVQQLEPHRGKELSAHPTPLFWGVQKAKEPRASRPAANGLAVCPVDQEMDGLRLYVGVHQTRETGRGTEVTHLCVVRATGIIRTYLQTLRLPVQLFEY